MLSNAPVVPYIPVRDVTRARKFYEEKVGLKPKQEYAGGVIYECGKGSWVFMRGIKTVDGIATGGGAKTAWFKDTEGNVLAVSQRLLSGRDHQLQ
jgi:hypothetical protein